MWERKKILQDYIATKDEAIEQIETAEMLISKIEEYISNRSGKESK